MFLKKKNKTGGGGIWATLFCSLLKGKYLFICIAKQKSRKYVFIFNFEINNRNHVIHVFSILVQQNIFTTIALAVPQWIGTLVPARLLPTAP